MLSFREKLMILFREYLQTDEKMEGWTDGWENG